MNPFARYTIPLLRARQIIKDLQIRKSSEIDVAAIAAFYDALVRFDDIRGSDGRMVRSGDSAVITVRKSIGFEGQRRFIIAHELGHFLLHPQIRQIDEVTISQLQNWSTSQAADEIEANLFAAELLMPESLFAPKLKAREPNFDFLKELAEEFQTTLISTAIQFLKYTKEECVLVASEGMKRKWFIPSNRFEFWLNEDPTLHGYSCAYEVASGKKERSHAKNIPAGAWLRDFEPNGKERVTEDAISSKSTGLVFSLIWIHAAI